MDQGWCKSWRMALLAQAALVWGASEVDAVEWVERGNWSRAKATSVVASFDDTMRQRIAALQAKWAAEGKVTIEP